VHVWRVPLVLSTWQLARLVPLLSRSELSRLEARLGGEARRRYIASHGALRVILGGYLGTGASLVPIETGDSGKPYLAARSDLGDVTFSLSHSHEIALCAVGCCREIGVDIERIRPVIAASQIAARYFSESENADWQSLPPDKSLQGFAETWTRKEAYAKTQGQGISRRWQETTIHPQPDRPAGWFAVADSPANSLGYQLCSLHPGPGYAAAVAAEGQSWRLACWQWEPECERGEHG
jgi:4'-phosphopantetheinyl transferase